MKNGIKAETYYFLLDWKDKNMKEYISIKGESRLCELTPYELNKLYEAIMLDSSSTNNV
jgi:hypothetical protein